MHRVLHIAGLPEGAVAAAAQFYDQWLGQAEAALTQDCSALSLVFPDAPVDHADWRRAVARDLARAHAPDRRVNCVAGGDEARIAATLAYLGDAPGITGQYLPVHDENA